MSENATKSTNLRTNQRVALQALVSGESIENAAQMARCNVSTIYRWLREDSQFSAELREQSLATVAASARRLRGQTGGAIGVLVELMNDTNTAASVRRSAANDIIAYAIKTTEINSILERLEALEQG